VRVAVLCPQGVQTAMLDGATHRSPAVLDGVLTAPNRWRRPPWRAWPPNAS
jgi:hypothetical protein